MRVPVVETKFNIPQPREGRVARPRLVERLVRGTRGKLTVVSAPPGFGKTSLLADWLSTANRQRVAWLSLDAADDNPPAFWQNVVRALAAVEPAISDGPALELLEGPQLPSVEGPLTLVLNVLASGGEDVWLVLDDYHVIQAAEIHAGMAFLLDHAPRCLHVVLASRVDPPLQLSRLRTRGELTEIRAQDLRFTAGEAAAFLNESMDLGLTEREVNALETRTEGWAGALQLAALSLQGRPDPGAFIDSFSGDDRYIVDYLVEEVLDRQAPETRAFLLRTSILDRLSASLCDAVLESSGSRKALEALERGNLFLAPLDDRREWFRYHQLFSDVLRAHLADEFPGEAAPLHQRASEWFAEQGEPDHAIRHAMAAKDFVRAAGLIELQAETVMRHHHPDRLVAWLKPIPPEVVRAMPVLSVYYGHALQGMGDMERSAERIDDAERAMGDPAAIVFDQHTLPVLEARIALGRGYLAMAARDPEATVKFANRALAGVRPGEHHWRGTPVALLGLAHWIRGELGEAETYHAEAVAEFERAGDTGLAITSAYHHAELLRACGHLSQAIRRLESSVRFIAGQRNGASRGVANLHLGLSELYCERNDLESAEREIETAQRVGVYPPRTPFRLCLARAHLLQCRGDFVSAIEQLDEAERLQVRGAVPDYRPVAAWRVRLFIAQENLTEAEQWARQVGVSAADELRYDREYEHITLARLLLARSDPQARKLLERLLEDALLGQRHGTAIEIRVLLARALWSDRDRAAAMDVLGAALTAAAPESYARVVLDEGDAITPLLQAARDSGRNDYARALLDTGAREHELTPAASLGPESLTEREREVLRLLSTELSGPEIADAMVVSLNTMRTHTKNVYGKLGVSTRRAAIRRAQELGIL